jgi:tRNA (cytidine/uridine-2'-O-)-methyltransferase
MHIALYQPDIAQNTGTILRLAACLGISVHIIEPAGFPVSDRAFRRAGMDYLGHVSPSSSASRSSPPAARHLISRIGSRRTMCSC